MTTSVKYYFSRFYCIFIVLSIKQEYTIIHKQHVEGSRNMFILLAGGLLVILFAVIVAVVSSVTSAVAADQDEDAE